MFQWLRELRSFCTSVGTHDTSLKHDLPKKSVRRHMKPFILETIITFPRWHLALGTWHLALGTEGKKEKIETMSCCKAGPIDDQLK